MNRIVGMGRDAALEALTRWRTSAGHFDDFVKVGRSGLRPGEVPFLGTPEAQFFEQASSEIMGLRDVLVRNQITGRVVDDLANDVVELSRLRGHADARSLESLTKGGRWIAPPDWTPTLSDAAQHVRAGVAKIENLADPRVVLEAREAADAALKGARERASSFQRALREQLGVGARAPSAADHSLV